MMSVIDPKINLFNLMLKNTSKHKDSSRRKPGKKKVNKLGKGTGKKISHISWVFPNKCSHMGATLYSTSPLYTIDEYQIMTEDVKSLIQSLVRNHGFTDGAGRYAVIKNYIIDLIEERKPENPKWLSTSKTWKIPSKVGEQFIQLLVYYFEEASTSERAQLMQVVLTLLNLNRCIEGLVKPNFLTVTDKCQPIDEEFLNDYDQFLGVITEGYTYPANSEVNFMDYGVNAKKFGPNGKPKLESAVDEALELHSNPRYWAPFVRICEELGGSHLTSYIETLVESKNASLANNKKKPKAVSKGKKLRKSKPQPTYLRKIVSIPDKGFKTRLVAISDFWTQLILEPFRRHVQLFISRRYGKSDFRMNQNAGVERMRDFQKRCLRGETVNGFKLDVKHLKFYDVSTWSDRFHRDLQKILCSNLFPSRNPKTATTKKSRASRFSEAWGQIVVHCPWYCPDSKSYIKYGQGQGMGTNGSFDITTATSHTLIEFMFNRAGSSVLVMFPDNDFYGEVGDDLWIYDPEGLFEDLCKIIYLPINLSKSKMYCEAGSIAEFCARTFWNGTDVSRISPNIISKSKDYKYLPNLIALCASRGIQLSSSSFPFLNNTIKETGESYLNKIQEWIIGSVVLGVSEQNSDFKLLTADYLDSGGWITSDKLKLILDDPPSLSRLIICHYTMQMIRNWETVEIKCNEVCNDQFLNEVQQELFTPGLDLYRLDNVLTSEVTTSVNPPLGVLEPKHIIMVRRYIDQSNLIEDAIADTLEITSINQMIDFSNKLADIAEKSSYDDGILRYSSRRIKDAQYAITKTLQVTSEDFKTMYIDSSDRGRVCQDILDTFALQNDVLEELPTFEILSAETN